MSQPAKPGRELLLRVTIKDCDVQTFRAGGPGGQNQNKTSSGVRVIHKPSGARGESREERSQLLNKRKAFRRMGESLAFQMWIGQKLAQYPPVDEVVDKQMRPENLVIETSESGRWEVVT